jgi:hypothetical protein
MLKSIMGKVVDCRESYRWARVLKPSGFGKVRPPKKYTGYHKMLPKAEMKALAFRLQREAR